jgi:hypothetical protein
MATPQVETFLAGMVTMGFVVAGAFFVRFWRQTRDQLFFAFALAFWLMATNQIVSHLFYGVEESRGQAYVLRLAAFLLIAGAVVRKNAGAGRKR